MTELLDDLAVARQPRQERSRKRFEAVLAEADTLLAAEGLSGFSIPTLAERLGYNRRSIYSLFPSPYAILNELTRRYILRLEEELTAVGAQPGASVDELVARHTFIATNFHNRHPVGRLLILGGAATDKSFRAQELTCHRLGELGRLLLRASGYQLPVQPVDVAVLCVELGQACMRLSHGVHGYITSDYAIEAVFVMLSYLAATLEDFPVVDRVRICALAEALLQVPSGACAA